MAESILTTHESLRIALKEYITAQYLRRIPVLLEALEGRLDQEGVLFQEPYIESSPAYESVLDGLSQASLPGWMKIFFSQLSEAGLGVYAKPFRHQVTALEQAVAGKDLFVSTGTGSGKIGMLHVAAYGQAGSGSARFSADMGKTRSTLHHHVSYECPCIRPDKRPAAASWR